MTYYKIIKNNEVVGVFQGIPTTFVFKNCENIEITKNQFDKLYDKTR